jgi:ketosteroid isomerase-like protein
MSAANVEIARAAIDAWNRGDVDAMLAKAAPEFEFVPAIATVVEGGIVRGEDAFRSFFENLGETWESFRIEPNEYRDLGDRVLALGRVQAKGRGSGLELDQPWAILLTLREGEYVRIDSFLDHNAAIAAAEDREAA